MLLDSDTVEAVLSRDMLSLTSLESAASDWILDAAISPFPGVQACVFVTAHCELLYASLQGEHQSPRLESLSSPLQSILYSAHVVWTSSSAGLVAAGTVFGEIEVIAWQLDSEGPGLVRQVITFTGHEGSVFGVQISPEIAGPDGCPTRLLASCSDDRTIRVWEVPAHFNAGIKLSQATSASFSVRETGFQTNGRAETPAKKSVAVAMGHISRIWRVRFLTFNAGAPASLTAVNILSFGEDATCQQWSLNTCSQKEATLTHLNTFTYHSGKHIWSVALLPDCRNSILLATGGADGKVSLYNVYLVDTQFPVAPETMQFRDPKSEDVSEISSLSQARVKCLTIEDILSSLPSYENGLDNHNPLTNIRRAEISVQGGSANSLIREKTPSKIPKDALNKCCFVTGDELLLTTSFGRVLLGSFMHPYSWRELKGPSSMTRDLKSYSLMLGISCRGTAILAGANGTIYMFHRGREEIRKIHEAQNKVASLFYVSRHDHSSLCFLAITLGNAEAQLLSVNPPLSQDLISNEILTIKLSPKFIVTSASYIHNLLVLGSRNGPLAFYDLALSNEPLHVIYDGSLENGDAVTMIINIPSLATCSLLTTSRNGSYSIFSLSTSHDNERLAKKSLSLILVHQSVPSPGLVIEAAWFDGSDLIFYGFRSKNFVVWDESKQCEVTSVECGGAHRNYTYLPVPGADGAGHLVYTKASKLYLHSQSRISHITTKSGGHGREIKACAVLDCKERKLIATGSEDTTIRIWSFKDSQWSPGGLADGFRCHAVLGKHTSGIKHLQWHQSQDYQGGTHYLFSAGGAEEFYVWAVSLIPGFGLGVVCVATMNDQSEERDLRIMSFDFVAIAADSAPQMPESKFRLTLVFSDSAIKIYEYSRTEGFHKLAHGHYTSHCLTQVVTPQTGNDQGSLLCTAATDGHLAVWEFQTSRKSSPETDSRLVPTSYDTTEVLSTAPVIDLVPLSVPAVVTPELKLLSRTRLHQSSILALAILSLPSAVYAMPGTDYIVATGGDDNALSLALFRCAAPVQRVVVPAAHAAAVSGVAFLNFDSHVHPSTKPKGDGTLRLLTVSNDQRIKQWRVDVRCTSGEDYDRDRAHTKDRHWRLGPVEEEDNVWCSVADAAGLAAFRGSTDLSESNRAHCLVYGAGMEMFGMMLDYGQRSQRGRIN